MSVIWTEDTVTVAELDASYFFAAYSWPEGLNDLVS